MKNVSLPVPLAAWRVAFLSSASLFLAGSVGAADVSTTRKLDDALELMLDRSIIEHFGGQAALRLGVPVVREKVIVSENPWDGRAFFISSMYQHDGVYHMLYRGMDGESRREGPETQYLCLATSKDGIKWEKPALGLVDFKGSRANNIVAF